MPLSMSPRDLLLATLKLKMKMIIIAGKTGNEFIFKQKIFVGDIMPRGKNLV